MQFDTLINRRGTNCAKWDTFDKLLGYDDIIHVGCADMDFKAPENLLARLHQVVDHGVFGYSDLFDDWYNAVIRYYKVHHNVELQQEEIVFCPRINIACGLVTEAFVRPQDNVLIHSPSYGPLRQAVEENGRQIIEVPLLEKDGHYSLRKEDLEAKVNEKTRMLILVNPHNPTTRVFTKEEMQIVADFCVEHDLILFTDEIHCDLLKQTTKFNTMLSLNGEIRNHLIVANSPAKTFNMPGLVGAYLVIYNEKIRNKVKEEISRIGEHNPNVFFNAALIEAYNNCDDYICNIRKYIDVNESYLKEEFTRLFPKCRIIEREATYLLWIDFSAYFKNEEELKDFFFRKARVGIYGGSSFGSSYDTFVRFNMAAPLSTLHKVINRISNALNNKAYNDGEQ